MSSPSRRLEACPRHRGAGNPPPPILVDLRRFRHHNSSSQGQLFYSQVAAAGTTQPFNVYPVTTCDTAEGVSAQDGVAAAFPTMCDQNGKFCGFTAISNDMVLSSTNPNGCKKIGQR